MYRKKINWLFKAHIHLFLLLVTICNASPALAEIGGLATFGYRASDSFFMQYTYPYQVTHHDSMSIIGPQIGLFGLQNSDLFLGFGGFAGYFGSVSGQVGLRIPQEKDSLLHLQVGAGLFVHLILDLESDFNKDHRFHIGIEVDLPI